MSGDWTPEEQAEHRRLWVEALRSGDYKQGKGYLKRDTDDGPRYCCLGVACEVAKANGLELSVRVYSDDGEGSTFYAYGRSVEAFAVSFLPGEVADWLGVTTQGLLVEGVFDVPPPDFSSLIILNDEADWTFEDIATLIEEGGVT